LECFDSLGVTETKLNNLKTFCKFKGIQKLEFNETAFQSDNSESCGLFVLYFIFHRMFNLDLSFDEILEEIFNIDKTINEQNIKIFCSSVTTNDIQNDSSDTDIDTAII
jgi:hypothetical protein